MQSKFVVEDKIVWWTRYKYNTQLKKRYRNDPLTHPEFDLDLWLKVGLSSGPNINQVYDISNTMVEDLRTTQSVSIVGCSQSVWTLEFESILNQRVESRTTHLIAETKWLGVETAEPHRLYMELKSQMGGKCVPPY